MCFRYAPNSFKKVLPFQTVDTAMSLNSFHLLRSCRLWHGNTGKGLRDMSPFTYCKLPRNKAVKIARFSLSPFIGLTIHLSLIKYLPLLILAYYDVQVSKRPGPQVCANDLDIYDGDRQSLQQSVEVEPSSRTNVQ